MLLAVGLVSMTSGCLKTSTPQSPNIYAPSVITLLGGTEYQLKEGALTPSEDSVFYRSDYVQELHLKLNSQ